MKDDITIHGGPHAFAPGLIDWCMGCTRTTFDEETRDVGARMFALAGFLPELSAQHLRQIAQKTVTYSINEEANTVTLHTTGTNA